MLPNINKLNTTCSNSFFLIAGPCVVESEELTFWLAEELYQITQKLSIPFIYKASYKKANRTSVHSFTGIGDKKALDMLKKISEKYHIPVLTDVHSKKEAMQAAEFVDILQIPAFLCRQTELITAAAQTGKWINVKKGQFLSPEAMKFTIDKAINAGNHNIMVTERGTTFGYNDLIVDFRSIPKMQQFKVPVIIDVTHSLQLPNKSSGITEGNPNMIETIAKAGIAVGADGLFIETHPNPKEAKSDAATMLKLDLIENLLEKLIKIRKAID